MKKLNKKDYIYIGITLVSFLILILLLTKNTYLFASTLDWPGQHVTIPEYFRTLFYSTFDIFPDLALNIGNGQNIYNFSYYGLLSPIILISYLLPFISMQTYLIGSSIIIAMISSVMLYLFLHKHKYSSEVCFISSFLFIFSSAISFQIHRHIMFVNYMPFLILGLSGVDKIFNEKKSWLLTLSTFLMIMTSYYFSIGGILCLFIYALYRYLNHMNKVTIKSFFKTLFSIIVPVLVAVLCSAIITIPTLSVLISGRAESNTFISFKDLLLPAINTRSLLYYHYGIGLTAIIIPAIINLFKKNKANITLGIILTIVVIFNIFNYILNGTMYIDGKSLIPLLPLYILVIADFLKDLFNNKVNYKVVLPISLIIIVLLLIKGQYIPRILFDLVILILVFTLYISTKKKSLFIIPLLLFVFIHSYCTNELDDYILKNQYNNENSSIKEAIDTITTSDGTFYRTALTVNKSVNTNKIFDNINFNVSTIYSSTSNQDYNKFYFDTLTNNIASRNRAITSTTNNLLSLMLSNNKYLITEYKPLQGYELVSTNQGISIYKNDNTMPLGYATSNIMNYEDFNNLPYQVKQEALLNVVVADAPTSNKFISTTKKMNFDIENFFDNKNIIINDDNSYIVKVEDSLTLTYELPEEYKEKIIFIRFNVNNNDNKNDLIIKINNTQNKLTAYDWKYHNGNSVFDFVLASQDQDRLIFNFSKGTYKISDFDAYVLDYVNIENCSKKVDRLIIDQEYTKGDSIVGDINVVKDGYFTLTIPYSKGYSIKVDGKKIAYEKVNEAFIGFPITEGNHHIEIEFHAPGKNLSLGISLFGIIVFISITYLESKRCFV